MSLKNLMIIRYNAGTYMIALGWLNIQYPTPISDFRSTVPTSIPACIGRFPARPFRRECSPKEPFGHYSKDVLALKRIIIKNSHLFFIQTSYFNERI
jgi:hypothetical protein